VLSALVVEELSAGCAGIATVFGAHLLGIAPILLGGSLEHIDGYLYEITSAEKRGEPILMAFAITEPTAGTDVEEPDFLARGAPQTHARKVPDGYLLNGTKCFISNGSVARYITVYMPLDRDWPLETWTCFLVDTRKPGFSVSRLEHKMGQRACHAAEIVFDDYFVPRSDLVGEEGSAMQPGTLLVLAGSRPPVGAISTGIARGALERFRRWAHVARNGKRPDEEQVIQLAIMDMQSKVQMARQLYMDACMFFDFASCGRVLSHPVTKAFLKMPRSWRVSKPVVRMLGSRLGKKMAYLLMRMVTGKDDLAACLAHSSMAKAVASDIAMEVTSRCLELMGHESEPERLEIEKCFRDAKLTQIYEGTNQLNMLTAYRALDSKKLEVVLPGLR
jgi:butyryl-CoA dehydrogenase